MRAEHFDLFAFLCENQRRGGDFKTGGQLISIPRRVDGSFQTVCFARFGKRAPPRLQREPKKSILPKFPFSKDAPRAFDMGTDAGGTSGLCILPSVKINKMEAILKQEGN